MTSKKTRVTMGFIALLFIATTLGSTALIIGQIIKDNKQAELGDEATHVSQTSQPKENQMAQLAGTQLTNFTPTDSVDKLQAIDLEPGNGDTVKPGDTVTVDYTGAVAATGKIFQSSKDSGQPITFSLSQVIAGWSQGVPGMKVGGTRRLLIPADLAYGSNPPGGSGIPANAPLVFDITLHKIGQ